MKTGIILIATVLVFCACKKSTEETVVARVGNAQLTVAALYELMPSIQDQKLGRLQAERYVQQWVESELLYQQALQEKIEKQPEVRQRLEKLQRDYVVSAYLQQQVDREAQGEVDGQEYYQSNSDEFKAEEDLYKVDLILLETLAQARTARNRLVAGEDFALVAKNVSMDFSRYQDGHLGFISLRQLSPLLAAAVPGLKVEEVSQPIKSEMGYNLLRLQCVVRKGQIQPYEEVKEIVRQRMQAKKREELYRRLISNLSDKVKMSTDLSVLSLQE
jgi:parvulin-like peptidyl-prolyl isomerase